jgi:hypothetical protein
MHRNTHAHPRGDAHHFAFTNESVDQLTDFLLRKRPHPFHCALNLQFSLDNIREGATANCTHQSHQHGPYLRRADPDRDRKDPLCTRESSQSPSALCSRCTLSCVLGKPPPAAPNPSPSRVPGTKYSDYAPDSSAPAPDTTTYAPDTSAYSLALTHQILVITHQILLPTHLRGHLGATIPLTLSHLLTMTNTYIHMVCVYMCT